MKASRCTYGTFFASAIVLLAGCHNNPQTSSEPRIETDFVQAVQVKPIDPRGFTPEQARRAGAIYDDVVEALNNLDAAMGIERKVGADGNEVVTKVTPSFGVSRMARLVKHGGTSVFTKGVHKAGDPWLLIFGASGKPLTAQNIEEVTRFGKNPMVEEMAVKIKKRVAAANLGREFDFETTKHYGYAKPIKLTKKECLPCHAGMNVGDTVAIAVFTHLKKSTK